MTSSYKIQFQTVKTQFSLLVNSKTRLRTSSGNVLVSKTSNIRGNIHNQFGQCINKGIHSLLPLGTEFKSPKDFYFSSSICGLAICLELLWIFEIKQAVPIVHNLAWAPLKNCTWSEAFKFIVRRDNFMIYSNGWFSGTILWFVLSGLH